MNTQDSLVLNVHDYDKAHVGRNETLFTTANGFLGLRGDYEEKNGCFHKGTYINGFYDTEPITYGETAFGYAKNHETILNLPDPKRIELTVNDVPFSVDEKTTRDFSLTLDLRTGIMTRMVTVQLSDGTAFKVTAKRLVSFTHQTCAVIQYTVSLLSTPAESATISLQSAIDISASNISAEEDPRVGAKFSSRPLIIDSVSSQQDTLSFTAHTRNSGLSLAGTAVNVLTLSNGNESSASSTTAISADRTAISADSTASSIGNETSPSLTFSFTLRNGESAVLEKYISYAFNEHESKTNASVFASSGFAHAVLEQKTYLAEFWKTAQMKIGGSFKDEQAVNCNLFHLLQSAGKDGSVSIAAKGLTAEGYEGHFFWDTEAYVCPVFTYIQPAIARALLSYRAHILPLAQERARELSLQGALFPWRTISGHETSAYYPAGTAQYHIDADIMFALNRYLTAAGFPTDNTLELTTQHIAHMAVETARMWMSLGCYVEDKGFCINEVTGPDEYTACVDNNAYTNLMARENLRISASIAQKYDAAQMQEIDTWKEAADKMYIPFDKTRGIYPQDDSFMAKADWDFANTPKENYPLLLHYHPLVIYRHRVLKQPDLVLAQFLLSGLFTREEKIRNFLFYEKYTTGDSSLSHCIQCIAACEASDRKKAFSYFCKTANMDIADVNGNTADGIHTACMAGSWMAVVYGFAGFRDYGGKWTFNPQLPDEWESLSFSLLINGARLSLSFTKENASYTLNGDTAACIEITHRNTTFTLHRGETKTFSLTPALKAVLFDLDGVITNTAELHYRAWKKIAESNGLSFDREINKSMSGRSRTDSLELLLQENKMRWTREKKEKVLEEKNNLYVSSLSTLSSCDILPGIQSLLAELHQANIKCILASASCNAVAILATLGVSAQFDGIVDPTSLQRSKPEPDIYLHAAQLSGEWYTDCLGIEDAQSGIDAIKSAGIKAAGIGSALTHTDILFPSTAELTLAKLKQVFSH